ncbi:hypothetical protein GDO78_010123 [Eleutherodactylus coqui]|uniref:Uncharacterized protein n=1 Tax=Eleutherodactylus coqui TaxID=57060 RepID=A0A8J6FAK0_ELECQ|nr:hypothetical protein GDO78_010123 [Eleutherodactylus coqui]
MVHTGDGGSKKPKNLCLAFPESASCYQDGGSGSGSSVSYYSPEESFIHYDPQGPKCKNFGPKTQLWSLLELPNGQICNGLREHVILYPGTNMTMGATGAITVRLLHSTHPKAAE